MTEENKIDGKEVAWVVQDGQPIVVVDTSGPVKTATTIAAGILIGLVIRDVYGMIKEQVKLRKKRKEEKVK